MLEARNGLLQFDAVIRLISLPGIRTIPEQIVECRDPYYAALDAADLAWGQNRIDVSKMEELLSSLLARQLIDVHSAATKN